ncbi:MAG: Crp/Fnr family transcriptional regulator [Bacillota bacterium]
MPASGVASSPLGALGRSPVLGALPVAALRELSATMRPVQLQPGQILFVQGDRGDSVFVVESGRLRVFRTSPGGKERTLAYLRAGEVLGEMAVLGHLPRSASVQAVDPSRLWRLDGHVLLRLLASEPGAALGIVQLLARRLADADRQLEETSGRVAERLAPVLRRLAAQASSRGEPGSVRKVRITQQELAEMVSATRESVNRGLARLQALGVVVRRSRGCLWVVPDRL